MPGIAIGNNTYQGEYANEILTKMLMVGRTISQGGITVYQDIKKKQRMPLMNMDDGAIAAYTDEFTPGADIPYSERELEPKGFSLHKTFTYSNLRQFFFSNAMALGLRNTDVPSEVETAIIALFQNFMSNRMDAMIWNSDTANAGLAADLQIFDGLLKKMAADPDVVPVAATTLTKANIIEEMEKVHLAEAVEISDKMDLFYYMDVRSHKLYKQALGIRDQYVQDQPIQGGIFFDENRTFMALPNFPANTIVATTASNLGLGTDLLNEENQVEIKDMRESTLDHEVRFRADGTADVNFARGEEVVLYS